jgi:hypothetical protein
LVAEVEQGSFVVDFFRGPRDYLRAADLIEAAPIPADVLSFDLRLKAVASHPGQWRRDDPARPAPAMNIAATLALACLSHQEHWAFVVDTSVQVNKHLPDIDESAILPDIVLANGRLRSPLRQDFSFWDQLIAAARAGGEQLFPGCRWYLVRIEANEHVLHPPPGLLELGVTLGRRRNRFLELHFDLDGMSAGRLGLMLRD